jgi:hypothetical protein
MKKAKKKITARYIDLDKEIIPKMKYKGVTVEFQRIKVKKTPKI